MQVSCPECATRLQLSAVRLPDQPFTIKCPRCQSDFIVTPPTAPAPDPIASNHSEKLLDDDPLGLFDEKAGAAKAESPASSFADEEPATPNAATPEPQTSSAPTLSEPQSSAPTLPEPQSSSAPALPEPQSASMPPTANPETPAKPELPAEPPVKKEIPATASNASNDWSPPSSGVAIGWTNSMPAPTLGDDSKTLMTPQHPTHDLLQALAALLTSGSAGNHKTPLEQNRHRHIVACLADDEAVKKVQVALNGQPYDLTIASSPEEVTTMLQTSSQLDILLLDPNFHAHQQGGATIMRYLNMLNPARRRRVFVVVISHNYRSLDTQAAFIHGVNLVINSNDLETLPMALSKSIQEFNYLYRAFNEASGASAF